MSFLWIWKWWTIHRNVIQNFYRLFLFLKRKAVEVIGKISLQVPTLLCILLFVFISALIILGKLAYLIAVRKAGIVNYDATRDNSRICLNRRRYKGPGLKLVNDSFLTPWISLAATSFSERQQYLTLILKMISAQPGCWNVGHYWQTFSGVRSRGRSNSTEEYLTIIPRARMGSKSIAHEAEGRMGYWLRGHEGERNNCFSKIQLVEQKNIETKHLSLVKARF